MEHLNVLLRIFFVSSVFQNFDFLSSIWISKLLACRITENSSHCYILRTIKRLLSTKTVIFSLTWDNIFYRFGVCKIHTLIYCWDRTNLPVSLEESKLMSTTKPSDFNCSSDIRAILLIRYYCLQVQMENKRVSRNVKRTKVLDNCMKIHSTIIYTFSY